MVRFRTKKSGQKFPLTDETRREIESAIRHQEEFPRTEEGHRYLESAQRRQIERKEMLSRINEEDYHKLLVGIEGILQQDISEEEKEKRIVDLAKHIAGLGEVKSQLAESELFSETPEQIHQRKAAMSFIRRLEKTANRNEN